jgi:uncharacterized protein (TIGR02145 family)
MYERVMGKAIKFAYNQKSKMKETDYTFNLSALLFVVFMSVNIFSAFSQSTNHSCGAANVHNPGISNGQVSDIDGNTYKTVVIDDLVWFSENLKVKRFQNGDSIPHVSDSASWAALTGPGMCSYQNDTSYDCPYGKLYNFFVASDSRNPCPNGWRVPSIVDYDKLINYYDSTANGGAPSSLPNSAGGFLKSSGLTYWQTPNTNATNASGFAALPNGGRNNAGVFSFTGNTAASYWYSTQLGTGNMGFFLELAYSQNFAVRNAYFRQYGICIRCVTDLNTLSLQDNQVPQFSVYPNPSNDFITINAANSTTGKEYILSDLTGRELLRGHILSENQMISISQIPTGMYFVHITGGNSEVKKIIKQ